MTKLLTLFGSLMLFLALSPGQAETNHTNSATEKSIYVLPVFDGELQFDWEHPAFISVGQQIKEARKQKGMTIEALARIIELTPKQLLTIELGDATPTKDIIGEIEQLLECEIILDGYIQSTE